jgi:hypothetical protein
MRETYDAAIAALREAEQAGGRREIDIASLQGHAEHRHLEPASDALRLKAEVTRLVEAGWSLRRVATVSSVERLEQLHEEMVQLERDSARPLTELRAFVTDSLPLLAPMVVGGWIAIAGLEARNEFGIASGLELRDPHAVALCAEYFQMLWDDERAIRLRTPAGIRGEGFERARRDIAARARSTAISGSAFPTTAGRPGDRAGADVAGVGAGAPSAERTAFVVMQFGEPYDALYERVIGPVCLEQGLEPVRADDIFGPGVIVDDITDGIREAAVVIAEVSPANANVYYELGFAHAIGKPSVLLAAKDRPLPFDIRGHRCIFYEDTIGGKAAVEASLRRHLSAIALHA